MHSNRMRTAHSLPHRGGCDGSLNWGVSIQGGLYPGVSVWGVSVRETPGQRPPGRNMGPDTETLRRNMEPETETPQKEHRTMQPDRK